MSPEVPLVIRRKETNLRIVRNNIIVNSVKRTKYTKEAGSRVINYLPKANTFFGKKLLLYQ